MGTIEQVFEFLLLFRILLHVLPEREHFGHIFYLNRIPGHFMKFQEKISNSRRFPVFYSFFEFKVISRISWNFRRSQEPCTRQYLIISYSLVSKPTESICSTSLGLVAILASQVFCGGLQSSMSHCLNS